MKSRGLQFLLRHDFHHINMSNNSYDKDKANKSVSNTLQLGDQAYRAVEEVA